MGRIAQSSGGCPEAGYFFLDRVHIIIQGENGKWEYRDTEKKGKKEVTNWMGRKN